MFPRYQEFQEAAGRARGACRPGPRSAALPRLLELGTATAATSPEARGPSPHWDFRLLEATVLCLPIDLPPLLLERLIVLCHHCCPSHSTGRKIGLLSSSCFLTSCQDLLCQTQLVRESGRCRFQASSLQDAKIKTVQSRRPIVK